MRSPFALISQPRLPSFRLMSLALVAAAIVPTAGCQLVDAGRALTRSTTRLMTPSSRDYDTESMSETDEWSRYGRAARGDRAVEQEGVLQFSSSKAKSINRSLGVDPWEAP